MISHNRENSLEKSKWLLKKSPTVYQILTIHQIIKGVRAKNLEATLLFAGFFKAFDSIYKEKMEQILLTYGLPKETYHIMMLY